MITKDLANKTIDLLRAVEPALKVAYIAGCQSGNQTGEDRDEGFKEWVKDFYKHFEEVGRKHNG